MFATLGKGWGDDVYIDIIPKWSIWDARGIGAMYTYEWETLSYYTARFARHTCLTDGIWLSASSMNNIYYLQRLFAEPPEVILLYTFDAM